MEDKANKTTTTTGATDPSSNQSATPSSSSGESGAGQQQQQQQAPLASRQDVEGTPTTPSRSSRVEPGRRPRRRRRPQRRRVSRQGSLFTSTSRRLFQNISQEGNQTEDASESNTTGPASLTSSTSPLAAQAPAPARLAPLSNPAVRILFREQQLQLLRQQVISGREARAASPSGTCTSSEQSQNQNRAAASIIEANRRLIERQIEAIREADSRRWNFDFRNCQPLIVTSGSNNNTMNDDRNSNANNDNNNNNSPATTGSSSPSATSRNLKPLNDKNRTD